MPAVPGQCYCCDVCQWYSCYSTVHSVALLQWFSEKEGHVFVLHWRWNSEISEHEAI